MNCLRCYELWRRPSRSASKNTVSRELLNQYLERFPGSVGISAKTREGIDELMSELGAVLRPVREFIDLSIPHEASSVIARLHAMTQVLERDYSGETARFKARIPPHLRSEFAGYVVRPAEAL